MIYLFGLNHSLQSERPDNGDELGKLSARLRTYLDQVIHQYGIKAIAEESNDDVEKSLGKKTLARNLAEIATPPLQYIACEPSIEERKALGIPSDIEIASRIPIGPDMDKRRDIELLKYFPLREKFWIERLRKITPSPILFICGPNHINTFFCRLLESGIPSDVISIDWLTNNK